MSELLKRLKDQRHNVWAQAKALADKAAEESRAFSAEEEGEWQRLNAELEALDKRMKNVAEGEKRAAETDAAFDALDKRPADASKDQRATDQGNELRSFLRGEAGAPRFFDVTPTGPGQIDTRDLTKLSAAAGGATVPASFYDRLVAHLIETSAVLQTGPTVLRTNSGELITVPKTTAHTANPAIVVEADPILESDPTFGSVTLGAYKYGRLIQVSRELVDDTGVDLEGYLAMQAGRALGNAFGQHMIVGTGTSQPRGVLTDAGPGVTPAAGLLAGGGFGTQATVDQGFDILINLFHSVIPPYRASSSAAWLMNDTTASRVRKIKNADGLYAWQPAVVAGAPDTILGKPVFIDPYMPSPGNATESIAFGDFSQYFVRFAGALRFERSDDFAFGNDLVSFRALLRADAALVDLTGAIKTLTHPAT